MDKIRYVIVGADNTGKKFYLGPKVKNHYSIVKNYRDSLKFRMEKSALDVIQTPGFLNIKTKIDKKNLKICEVKNDILLINTKKLI